MIITYDIYISHNKAFPDRKYLYYSMMVNVMCQLDWAMGCPVKHDF